MTKLPAEAYGRGILTLTAAKDMKEGLRTIAFDATLDGKRYGPWFDMIVNVSEKPTVMPPGAGREGKAGY